MYRVLEATVAYATLIRTFYYYYYYYYYTRAEHALPKSAAGSQSSPNPMHISTVAHEHSSGLCCIVSQHL